MNNNYTKEDIKEDIKEEFCTSCIGAGLAIAGVGASVAGSLSKSEHQVWKNVLLWCGVAIYVIAIILLITGILV